MAENQQKKTPTTPKNPCTCSVCWFLVVDFFFGFWMLRSPGLHHHSKRAGISPPQPPSCGLLIAQFGRSTAPPPAKSAKQLKKRRSVVYPTCIILFTCQSIQRTKGRQKHESKFKRQTGMHQRRQKKGDVYSSKTLFKVLPETFRGVSVPHCRLQQGPGLLHFFQQHSWPAAVCPTMACTALRNFERLLRPVSFSDLQVKRHGRRLRPGIASTHVHHTSAFVS